ncbi:helix-turn-helix domain-containing protein [Psychrobacter pygoscelis]|uniref:helix-turn-helix domain-containing protein n=1 Tax=Psychrobacter pygoscelis TaxID=2488563 RepID=UPI00104091BF|nr:helix-turn-helix domain-containing protein [Psychrobacter pygoscelis]
MAKHYVPSNGDESMSFKLVAAVFDMKVGNPLRKMVLIKLADQANDDGICWPSYESIAKSCEISRRSVVTHIQWLEDNNFLWVEKRYNSDEGKNYSNRYHLTLSKAKQYIKPKKSKKSKKSKSKGGENAALGKTDDSGENAALGSESDALGSAGAAPPSSAGAAPKPITKPTNESINESGEEETPSEPNPKSERELMVDILFKKWLELSGQRIKPTKNRLSHINARLDDGFTPDEITEAMTYVATDAWHISEGHNTIEIAIRSTEQIEKKLIKARAVKNKKPSGIDRKTDKLAVNNQWRGEGHSNIVTANTSIDEMLGGV